MRWIARMAVAVLVLTSPARGQQPAQAPQPAQNAAPRGKPVGAVKMNEQGLDQLLARWEERSGQMQTLDAQFQRTDTLITLGNGPDGKPVKEYYQGRAMLKSPNKAVLEFWRTDEDFKNPESEERILCTGDEVWQYGYKLKQITIHTLDKDQKRRALQQGPLPFLFNMKAADAKSRYRMTAWEDKAKEVYHLTINPLLPEDRDSFVQAGVTLDMKEFLPQRLILMDTNEKDKKEFIFKKIVRNTSWTTDPFAPAEVRGWQVIRDPVGNQPGGDPAGALRQNDAAAVPASNKQ